MEYTFIHNGVTSPEARKEIRYVLDNVFKWELARLAKTHRMYTRWAHKEQGWSFLFPLNKPNPANNPLAFKNVGVVWEPKYMEYTLS